jgi:hypothetical protein
MSLVAHAVDLDKHWPQATYLTTKAVKTASTEYFIGDYHRRLHAYAVMEQVGPRSCVKAWCPPRYRHALRFLNFKTSCFVSALTVEADINDMVEKEAIVYAAIRDGMSRQIVFNHRIRKRFFDDINTSAIRKCKGPRTQQGVLRSPAMDTWLIEEYLYQNHDPPTRVLLFSEHPSYQDPVELGASTEKYRTKSHK